MRTWAYISVKKESAVYCQKGGDETSKNFRLNKRNLREQSKTDYVNGAQGQLKHTTKFEPGEEAIDCVKKPQEPLKQLSRRCTGINVTDCIKLILELFHPADGFAL